MDKISVVINTLNEEKDLPRCIASVKGLADEIVVVDMESTDGTVALAKKLGAKVYNHDRLTYVEPARNYAISRATGNWILVLDVDEEIPSTLIKRLQGIVTKPKADYYRIPRKNIIFGKWIKHARWWPDYNIRFFKKGKVSWNEVIHSVPVTSGQGEDLPDDESLAIIHNNYETIEEYLEKMNRYSSVQSKYLISTGYNFVWKDLIKKPIKEFLSRYFGGEGYKDGLHGLALSALQAFSEMVMYLKVWQAEKFQPQAITLEEVSQEMESEGKEFSWWITEMYTRSKGFFTSLPRRIKRKLNL
jgi:(heptosyl)LPS beta-1,4-glucosyltransferase